MPLSGEYQPSPDQFVSDQVALYEASGGTEGTTLEGVPVIVLTSLGARSRKIRKTPLMRVEHEGTYAVVASQGGAPKHPTWYHNLVAHPQVELQDGAVRQDMTGDQGCGAGAVVGPRGRGLAGLRRVPEEHGPGDPRLRTGADARRDRLTAATCSNPGGVRSGRGGPR